MARAGMPICQGMPMQRSARADFVMVVVALAVVWGPLGFIMLRLIGAL